MPTEMSITRALATLKSLNARIKSTGNVLTLVASSRGAGESREVISYTGDVEQCIKDIEGSYQSYNDLRKARDNIRSEILKSNATTIIKIGEREMTVVEAIDFKKNIGERKALRDRMVKMHNTIHAHQQQLDEDYQRRLAAERNSAMNSGKKHDEESLKIYLDPIHARYKPSVIDPLDISKLIADLNKEIEDFELNVDFALSESNASTKITVEAVL